jgi:hypothetical protein
VGHRGWWELHITGAESATLCRIIDELMRKAVTLPPTFSRLALSKDDG